MIGLDGRPVPNGCDWFPDGLLWWSWRHCCDVHDLRYSVGGVDWDRFAAEIEFFACLAGVSPLLALVMAPVTFLLGYAYFRRRRMR